MIATKSYKRIHPFAKTYISPTAKAALKNRPSYGMYSKSSWKRLRKAHLAFEPLCRICLAYYNREMTATVVDHIKPHRGNMAVFLDPHNLQSLCRSCHNRKTGRGE